MVLDVTEHFYCGNFLFGFFLLLTQMYHYFYLKHWEKKGIDQDFCGQLSFIQCYKTVCKCLSILKLEIFLRLLIDVQNTNFSVRFVLVSLRQCLTM